MPEPTPQRPAPDVPVTRMETNEEIQEAIRAARGPQPDRAAPAGESPPEPSGLEPVPERPVQRPPAALLCVVDDGGQDGEWLRLRADRCVIGRAEGDVRIPHDALMSGAHAEIVRESGKRGYQWVLRDLGSTNGTWVRIGTSALRHGSELTVGRGRYLFEGGEGAAPPPAPAPEDTKSTRPWRPDMGPIFPSLVEVAASGPGERTLLTKDEYWIGRDPACAIARRDDALVSARHARLYRDGKGRWHAENHRSLNGLWFRIGEKITLASTCQFRLGEQRFLFRVA